MKHKHHIVPRHMGGSDDPSNLIELTVEEHAEAHRILYEQHGHWQDKVAWQGLVGLIGHDEIMQEMWNARKGKGNTFYGKKHTEETKRLMSENSKGQGLGIPKNHGDKLKTVWAEIGHPREGKEPWNKGKTGLQTRTLDAMESYSIKIVYEGLEYPSINAASRATGLSPFKIKKATSK
jgi:hypothetical protein